MKASEVKAEVSKLLDGPVSRYSVSDVLVKRSKGPKALFTQTKRGHYRR